MIEMIVRVFQYAWVGRVDCHDFGITRNDCGYGGGEICPPLVCRAPVDGAQRCDLPSAKSAEAPIAIRGKAMSVAATVGESEEIRTRVEHATFPDRMIRDMNCPTLRCRSRR